MLRLDVGARTNLQIRDVTFDHFHATHETRLLYAADLHLSFWTAHVVEQLLDAIRHTQPHAVLLGGDLVDHCWGLRYLPDCIGQIVQICPVYAVSGNHDDYAGRVAVRERVEAAGGQWLEDKTICLQHGTDMIRLDGTCQRQCDSRAYSVLCAHYPTVFPAAIDHSYNLVLAGHLHGSQLVLAERSGLLYPGAWFFDWHGDRFEQAKTTLLVSRGVNSTLPIWWNCPREVILCRIH
jgi:uncharacterized protein